MYKYAVFDLDGTLANTLEDLANAVNYALEKNGYKAYPVEAYKQMVGSGIVNLVKKASGSEDENVIKTLKTDFDCYYSRHTVDKTCRYSGGSEMLSNKPDAFVESILGKLFPDIFFAKAWGKKEGFDIKPNPASLNAMLKELNADKSQVVYVGDSNVDVFTAQNGQVGFIGCAWGFRGEQELLEAGAVNVARTCGQLADMILA